MFLTGDVLDLAWSPLDKWLASCSVDNSVIVWNAEKFPEMVCVLNGHSSLVKGVAWDPVSIFFLIYELTNPGYNIQIDNTHIVT